MPDIQWHVGEDKDQETIARASAPRRSRRSWLAVIIVVILGAGLGMVYRSLPEPAPRPTPQPTPTRPPVPAKLFASIDREAQALAEGDLESLDALWNFANFQEEQQRLGFVTAWGKPDAGPQYDILDFGLLSDDGAWADIRQYRNGEYFRETRFYRLQNGRWQRTEADPRFWNAERQVADTPHFRVEYAPEDHEWVAKVVTQLERDYEQICADFACPISERQCVTALDRVWCSSYASAYTSTLKFSGATANVSSDGQTIEQPSPRVIGIYESQTPIHYELATLHMMAVPFTQMWQLAYHKPGFSQLPWPLANQPLVFALTLRELSHLQEQSGAPTQNWEDLMSGSAPGKADVYTDTVYYLENLWQSPAQEPQTSRLLNAYWFTDFLEQEFGQAALVKLLQNMLVTDPYKAFPAITSLPFDEVQRRWNAWRKSHIP
jgi:hypothetical protein